MERGRRDPVPVPTMPPHRFDVTQSRSRISPWALISGEHRQGWLARLSREALPPPNNLAAVWLAARTAIGAIILKGVNVVGKPLLCLNCGIRALQLGRRVMCSVRFGRRAMLRPCGFFLASLWLALLWEASRPNSTPKDPKLNLTP